MARIIGGRISGHKVLLQNFGLEEGSGRKCGEGISSGTYGIISYDSCSDPSDSDDQADHCNLHKSKLIDEGSSLTVKNSSLLINKF